MHLDLQHNTTESAWALLLTLCIVEIEANDETS